MTVLGRLAGSDTGTGWLPVETGYNVIIIISIAISNMKLVRFLLTIAVGFWLLLQLSVKTMQ